jgi:diguanylate cyclase (GGDEF)-like protein/PAS domain S-box-containing protein
MTTHKKNTPTVFGKLLAAQKPLRLRAAAEAQLAGAPLIDAADHAAKELLHELRVHQIELEMQNEGLKEAQIALEASRDRFVDFYEHSPVAYLTLSDTGVISDINLTGAKLLGVERRNLLKRLFSQFVAREYEVLWRSHFRSVLNQDDKLDCELILELAERVRCPVRIDSLRLLKDGQPPSVRIVLTDISQRQQAESALRESEEHYRRLAEDMPLFISTFLPDGTLTYANSALCNLVAMSPSELTGRNFFDFLSVSDREMVRERLAALTPEHPLENHLQWHPRPDELDTCQQWTNRAFFDTFGKLVGFQAFGEDITERKLAEDRLREQEEFFRLIAENIGDFIAVLDLEGKRLYSSPSYKKFFGKTIDLKGTDSFAEIHPEDQERVKRVFRETVQTGIGIGQELAYRFLTADGSIREMESRGSAIKDQKGRVVRVMVVSRDVTEHKEMEERIRQLAFYDPLTQLPNRRLLDDRLSQSMAASARSACYCALIFLDLDNFKPLNDLHGHLVGDLLLIQAAERLKGCVREMDTVARFGGDEFVLIINELDADKTESLSQARIIAEKILAALSAPYRLTVKHKGKADALIDYRCTSSLGLVLFVNHQATTDELLKWADTAMYQAKDAGRNTIRFFDQDA